MSVGEVIITVMLRRESTKRMSMTSRVSRANRTSLRECDHMIDDHMIDMMMNCVVVDRTAEGSNRGQDERSGQEQS